MIYSVVAFEFQINTRNFRTPYADDDSAFSPQTTSKSIFLCYFPLLTKCALHCLSNLSTMHSSPPLISFRTRFVTRHLCFMQ